MFDKITNIIKEKNLKPADCGYHTLRALENNGKVRALWLKGEKDFTVELICPSCGKYNVIIQEWKPVSKAAKFKFIAECPSCGTAVKVPKLKGGPKEKSD